MREFVNYLLFGWYPYICITVLILGSIIRFDREQYTWRSQSSQFLRRRQMMWGSNLFHVGVLILLVGHFIGLLTPIGVFDGVGVAHDFKQVMALIVGGIAGMLAWVGCTLLLHRRLFDSRIPQDIVVGGHRGARAALAADCDWPHDDDLDARSSRWRGDAEVHGMGEGLYRLNRRQLDLILDAYFSYKLHIVLGLTLFLITPFTRLVHILSVPAWYLGRAGYQVVRSAHGATVAPGTPRGRLRQQSVPARPGQPAEAAEG